MLRNLCMLLGTLVVLATLPCSAKDHKPKAKSATIRLSCSNSTSDPVAVFFNWSTGSQAFLTAPNDSSKDKCKVKYVVGEVPSFQVQVVINNENVGQEDYMIGSSNSKNQTTTNFDPKNQQIDVAAFIDPMNGLTVRITANPKHK